MNGSAGENGPESAYWADFGAAQTQEQFLASWLGLLCAQIAGVRSALLLIASGESNTYTPGAVWPDASHDVTHLGPIAQQALTERRGLVVPRAQGDADSGAYVAYPVELAGQLRAAVVLDTAPRPAPELQQALRLMHWAIAWLIDLFRQQLVRERDETVAHMALVNGVVATALQEREFGSSVLAAANDLAARLECDRVSVGFDRSGNADIVAISHTASFDRKTNVARLIADAMDEVLDLGASAAFPAQGDDALGCAAQAALAAEAGDAAVLSVPLVSGGTSVGAVVFERNAGVAFDPRTIETCATAGLLLGPILDLKRDNERGALRRAWDSSRDGVRALFGPRHGGLKLISIVVLAVILLLSFAQGEYRVTARTVVEGAVQRAVAAPFEGYIAESFVRAGDVVREGQEMARLDDRDLRIEHTKWSAEREQYLRKYRQALASHDRAGMNVLGAQTNQAEAQLRLIEEKLARAVLKAPFDGVVVSGDLHQLLGTPVEQGRVLFETAPLNAYRIILRVDEREVAWVAPGQTGELALSGMPRERLRFTVALVTPVSTAEDGRNYFRVEARMDGGHEHLRPGMEGIGKVATGTRRLIWIWTHTLVDWLRISLWTWLP